MSVHPHVDHEEGDARWHYLSWFIMVGCVPTHTIRYHSLCWIHSSATVAYDPGRHIKGNGTPSNGGHPLIGRGLYVLCTTSMVHGPTSYCTPQFHIIQCGPVHSNCVLCHLVICPTGLIGTPSTLRSSGRDHDTLGLFHRMRSMGWVSSTYGSTARDSSSL